MPSVGCAHFPEMYAEYEQICERHGVQIRQSRNAATATRDRPARRLGIEEVAEHVHGPTGRAVVSACILAMQLGVCSVFMGLVAENARVAAGDWGTREQWVLLVLVPYAPGLKGPVAERPDHSDL